MSEDHLNSPRCRVCGNKVRMRTDETAGKHTSEGRSCRGGGLPVAGEPPCLPSCLPVGTVGYPDRPERGQTHASTVVCDSPSHQAEAAQWVKGITGYLGVFRPYERARQAS